MKTIIAVVVIVIVMGLLVQYKENKTSTYEYVKEQTTEVVQEPKEAWMTDEEAIKAAKDVIRKKELQSELETLDMEIKAKQEQRKKVTEELTAY